MVPTQGRERSWGRSEPFLLALLAAMVTVGCSDEEAPRKPACRFPALQVDVSPLASVLMETAVITAADDGLLTLTGDDSAIELRISYPALGRPPAAAVGQLVKLFSVESEIGFVSIRTEDDLIIFQGGDPGRAGPVTVESAFTFEIGSGELSCGRPAIGSYLKAAVAFDTDLGPIVLEEGESAEIRQQGRSFTAKAFFAFDVVQPPGRDDGFGTIMEAMLVAH